MLSIFRISKNTIVQLFSFLIMIGVQSCNYSINLYKVDNGTYKVQREYKNNYLYERHLHRKFYRNNSKDQYLPRYMNSVSVIKKNAEYIISYQCQNIIIHKEEEQYLSMFKTGLIHPKLFADSYSTDTTEYFVMIKELFDTPQKVERKRFEIICWPPDQFNPFVYVFEIRNNDACKETDFETFVRGAHISIWKFWGIQI